MLIADNCLKASYCLPRRIYDVKKTKNFETYLLVSIFVRV
jgi:hypothetical protein